MLFASVDPALVGLVSSVIGVFGTVLIALFVRNTNINMSKATTTATENATMVNGFKELTTILQADRAQVAKERDDAIARAEKAEAQVRELKQARK